MKTLRNIMLVALAGWLAGCASGPMKVFESKANQSLSAGIDAYNEGKYPDAVKSLQSALDQGLGTSDQVKAHKYLAFTHCVSGKERLCREEFRKALDINPKLELEPAEVDHPTWGRVFREAKARKPDARK
ncbi:MAG: TssQ family T6SS-associated lipoprotein [Sulfuritalea sp.]|nr:TssQ family T6SS-associated lipoprotein [Sulfuritalea sp.]